MKAIIGGKRYDTETATAVASAEYSSGRDFYHWSETLYRTKNGRWFLDGEGGPLSQYAVTIGQNQWSGGAKITTLSEQEARKWLERYGQADALEQYFASQIEEA